MNVVLNDRFQRAAHLLKALSHPLRLEMVCGLRQEPCTQTYIAETLGIPQSSVAQHLKVLRSQGLVRTERRGVEVVFSIADPVVTEIVDTLCGREDQPMRGKYTWEELAALYRERRTAGGC
jgi:DNA-binding transcriptional ArsR family regulator